MLDELAGAALAARGAAYAPYSRFAVGAALRTDAGAVHAGCNVENAAYPEGTCAEAGAIAAMVLDGVQQIREIAVIGRGDLMCTPCGGCRQRISEFAAPDTKIHVCGPEGLRRVSENAVLNANYLLSKVKHIFSVPQGDRCMHEFVASASRLKSERDVPAMDVAKRLLDYGFHAPTVYFPPIVREAMMIEPTETETRETLDAFAQTLFRISEEPPDLLHEAPHTTSSSRPDEVRAARQPVLPKSTASTLSGRDNVASMPDGNGPPASLTTTRPLAHSGRPGPGDAGLGR